MNGALIQAGADVRVNEKKLTRCITVEEDGLTFFLKWYQLEVSCVSRNWKLVLPFDQDEGLIFDPNGHAIGKFRPLGHRESPEWIIVEHWEEFVSLLRNYDPE